jgi:hypothetical protein
MLLQHPVPDKEPVHGTQQHLPHALTPALAPAQQPMPSCLFPALAPAHSDHNVLQDLELQELGLGLDGDGQLLCWPAECPDHDDDLLAFLGASGL